MVEGNESGFSDFLEKKYPSQYKDISVVGWHRNCTFIIKGEQHCGILYLIKFKIYGAHLIAFSENVLGDRINCNRIEKIHRRQSDKSLQIFFKDKSKKPYEVIANDDSFSIRFLTLISQYVPIVPVVITVKQAQAVWETGERADNLVYSDSELQRDYYQMDLIRESSERVGEGGQSHVVAVMLKNKDKEMADQRIWEQFLDAAKSATKKGGNQTYKTSLCKNALKLSDKLLEFGPISGDRYDLWKINLEKICTKLEGDNEMIRRTVREYFLALHSGDLSDFSIRFHDKVEGMSIGNVCEVNFSGMSRKIFIKCHQRGARSTSLSISNRYQSTNRPYIQEIFIYELLASIKVCGKVHFPLSITDTRKALYIATEEVIFTRAKELTTQNANSKAMILVDFLQFVLRLEDIGTNGGNYGQTDEGDPVVIDFWVVPKDDYVYTDDQFADFWKISHNNNSRLITDALKMVEKEKRKTIIDEAIAKWNLLEKLEQAKGLVQEFIQKNGGRIEVSGDLARYFRDIKLNVENVIKSFV